MSTDLRERQRTSAPGRGGVVPHPTKQAPLWPFVAAAIVVAVLLAVSAVMLTQGGQPGSFPDLNTGIREGSGYAQDGQPGSFPDLNTGIREGSGYAQDGQPGSFPDLNTGIPRGVGLRAGWAAGLVPGPEHRDPRGRRLGERLG